MGCTHGYVSSRPCGCVEFVTADDHDACVSDRRDTMDRLMQDEHRGLKVERLPLEDVRKAAGRMGYCVVCQPDGEVAP